MRKGEEKRQELLAVAERLFCQKGYEATSVQDILDVLHTSKGGFYHHFPSKEAVLNTLCQMRAERAGVRAKSLLAECDDDMQRLNIVLNCFMPLRREETPFMNMMMPLLQRPEGRALGLCYQEALAEVFMPLLDQELTRAYGHGVICPPVQDPAGVVLHMVNRCWLDVAMYLISCVKSRQSHDMMTMLSILNRYRRCVEVLLDAPFGSIEILRVDEWEELAARLIRTMIMPM